MSLGRTWISWISWRERQPWKTGKISFIRVRFYENSCLKCSALCNAPDLFSNMLQYLVHIATHSLWWLLLQICVAPLRSIFWPSTTMGTVSTYTRISYIPFMTSGQKRPQRRTRWTRRTWSKRRSCKYISSFLFCRTSFVPGFHDGATWDMMWYMIWRVFHISRCCSTVQKVWYDSGVLYSLVADELICFNTLLGSRCLSLRSSGCPLHFCKEYLIISVSTMNNVAPFGGIYSSLVVFIIRGISQSFKIPFNWLLVRNL